MSLEVDGTTIDPTEEAIGFANVDRCDELTPLARYVVGEW
jgi:hypothetical protein